MKRGTGHLPAKERARLRAERKAGRELADRLKKEAGDAPAKQAAPAKK